MKYDDYLKKLDHCPFCENVKEVIEKRENAILKYSSAPYTKDHLLILPKRHIKYFKEISEEEMRDIIDLENLAVRIITKLDHKNFFLLYREGDRSGKSIDHLHFHIIPDTKFKMKNAGAKRQILSEKESVICEKRLKKVISELKK